MMNSKNQSVTTLLSEVIQFPKRSMSEHGSKKDKPRDHGFREPNNRINAFIDNGLVSDKYPNFYSIGFTIQAFIDVILEKGESPEDEIEKLYEIKEKIQSVDGVIQIYTVFGEVDMRCKVVGIELQDIEMVSARIRGVEGVRESLTSIIIDDTDYGRVREHWANLIKINRDRLEDRLPSNST